MVNDNDADKMKEMEKDKIEKDKIDEIKLNNKDKKKFDINDLKNIDKKYFGIGAGIILFFIILICLIPKNKDKKNKKNKSNKENVKKVVKKQVVNNYYKNKAEANKYFEENRDYLALEYGKKCINDNPKNPNGYFVVVKALLSVKEYEESKKYLEKAKDLCVNEIDKENYNKLENILNDNIKKNEELLKNNINTKNIIPFLKKTYINGGKINKVQIDYNEHNVRGLIATDDINDDEVVVKMPKESLLIANDARKYICEKYSKADKVTEKEIDDIIGQCYSPNNFSLTFFILENIDNEKYKEYLDIIFSNNYESFPVNFNAEKIKKYENTDVINLIIYENYKFEHDLNELRKIKSISKYDDKTIKKVFLGVSSRTFQYSIHGKNNIFLCPYIDMGNHGCERNTRWYYDDNIDHFCLKSNKKIKKGEEITDTYGSLLPNKKLFVNYGFTDINNKNLDINLIFNDKQYTCKYINEVENNDITKLFDDIVAYIKSNKKVKYNNDKLELKKLEEFNKICVERLKKYKTTLEEDIKNLEDKNITFDDFNFTLINKDEKTLLNYFIEFSSECINFLKKNSIKNITKKIDDKKFKLSNTSKYYLKELSEKYLLKK